MSKFLIIRTLDYKNVILQNLRSVFRGMLHYNKFSNSFKHWLYPFRKPLIVRSTANRSPLAENDLKLNGSRGWFRVAAKILNLRKTVDDFHICNSPQHYKSNFSISTGREEVNTCTSATTLWHYYTTYVCTAASNWLLSGGGGALLLSTRTEQSHQQIKKWFSR